MRPPEHPNPQAKAKKTPDFVQDYQFKHAFTVTKEMEHSLHTIYEQFAKAITENFPQALNTQIKVEEIRIDKMSMRQFIRTLTPSSFAATIDPMQIGSTMVMTIEPSIVLSVINKMLGGDGDIPAISSGLQSLEMAYVRKLFNQILIELSQAWKPAYSLTFVLSHVLDSITPLQQLNLNDLLLVTTFTLSIGSNRGQMSIVHAAKTFGPLLAEAEFHLASDHSKSLKPLRLDDVPVPVTISFGTAHLSQADLLTLKPGDIIPIDFEASPTALVNVAGENIFSALPGLLGNYKGVILQKPIAQYKENPWMI